MKKRKTIIIMIIAIFMLCIVPAIVFATRNLIMYNPENGRPVISYDQPVPEELVGKEVSIQIPANQPIVDDESETEDDELNVLSNNLNIEEYSEEKIKAQYEEHQNLVNNFKEILYKYHGKEKMDKLYNDLNSKNTDVVANYQFPEEGKLLLQYVVDIFDNMNPLETEKEILREYAQDIVKINEINDKNLENRILNL